MKNRFFEHFRNVVRLEIKGKNMERFLHRLINHEIELLDVVNPRPGVAYIKIKAEDLKKVGKLKSIYDVSLMDTYGMIKIKKRMNKNRILFFTLGVGICMLLFLSQIIFEIEVVHTDKKLRDLLLKELSNYGIRVHAFKKDFHKIEEIKKDILERHKDTIEWLEIEPYGTKYIVRIEERKLNIPEEEGSPRNIVAGKSAVLKKLEAESGEVLKNINDYVKEGDVVISGEIKLNEELKNITCAKGKIFGEVWYQTKVEFPFLYKERFKTGKKKTVYTLEFFHFRFSLFDWRPYKVKESKKEVLWKHSFLPFRFLREGLEEVHLIENIYTEEEAIYEAEKLAKSKMDMKLKENEKILDQKNLKVEVKESKIEVDMFFTVLEDITSYQPIEPLKEPEKGE